MASVGWGGISWSSVSTFVSVLQFEGLLRCSYGRFSRSCRLLRLVDAVDEATGAKDADARNDCKQTESDDRAGPEVLCHISVEPGWCVVGVQVFSLSSGCRMVTQYER